MDELTVQEAAQLLGISRQHLSVLSDKGLIGRKVAGKYRVFTRAEVEAYRSKLPGSPGRPRGPAPTRAQGERERPTA